MEVFVPLPQNAWKLMSKTEIPSEIAHFRQKSEISAEILLQSDPQKW